MKPSDFLTELSNDKLTQYKTAAAADASKADKEGDFKKGDKRFSGIVKATKKQFDNDAKKDVAEGSETAADIDKKIEFHKQGQAAAQYKGSMNKMHAAKIRELEAKKQVLKQGVAEGQGSIVDKCASLAAKYFNSAGLQQQYDIDEFIKINTGDNVVVDKCASLATKYFNSAGLQQQYDIGEYIKANVRQGVAEGSEQKMSVQDTLAYLKKVMGTESHEDWRNHIINTNEYFVLKDISVNSLKSDLSGLNKTNVEKYKQMDFSKAPPIVIGSDGNILDGYHRANVAKALKVPTLKAWVGVKKQGVAEGSSMFAWNAGTSEEDFIRQFGKPEFDRLTKKYGISSIPVPDLYGYIAKEPTDPVVRRHRGLDGPGAKLKSIIKKQGVAEEKCPHCNGPMVSEELINEKKDACYYKVKSRYKVWPSAYASGALVKCRKKGADSWGNGGKKNESSILEGIEQADESLHDWFNKEKWVRMDTKGNIKGPCAKEPGEGKPKCLPQAKAHSLGKKGRASAAARKRREDPNPDRSGKAINVNTKKTKG